MAYEFKKLSAVEAVETPADTANVLIEEDGVIKKTPSGVFTNGGGGAYVVDFTSGVSYQVNPELHTLLLDKLDNALEDMPRIFIHGFYANDSDCPYFSPVLCFRLKDRGSYRTVTLYWAIQDGITGSTVVICDTQEHATSAENEDMN